METSNPGPLNGDELTVSVVALEKRAARAESVAIIGAVLSIIGIVMSAVVDATAAVLQSMLLQHFIDESGQFRA